MHRLSALGRPPSIPMHK